MNENVKQDETIFQPNKSECAHENVPPVATVSKSPDAAAGLRGGGGMETAFLTTTGLGLGGSTFFTGLGAGLAATGFGTGFGFSTGAGLGAGLGFSALTGAGLGAGLGFSAFGAGVVETVDSYFGISSNKESDSDFADLVDTAGFEAGAEAFCFGASGFTGDPRSFASKSSTAFN